MFVNKPKYLFEVAEQYVSGSPTVANMRGVAKSCVFFSNAEGKTSRTQLGLGSRETHKARILVADIHLKRSTALIMSHISRIVEHASSRMMDFQSENRKLGGVNCDYSGSVSSRHP